MRKGNVYLYYGEGKEKTALAIGRGIQGVSEELSVTMIQFMEDANQEEMRTLKRLEPEFRVFCFEKPRSGEETMGETLKKELSMEIGTGFHFTKKILETGECDMLILVGILDAITEGYLSEEEVACALCKKQTYMDVLLTGRQPTEKLLACSNFVYCITQEKEETE